MIKNFIGKITKPDNIFEYWGDFYVRCNGIPSYSIEKGDFISYEHRFQYQKVCQGYWGNWKLCTEWLGHNKPLATLEE